MVVHKRTLNELLPGYGAILFLLFFGFQSCRAGLYPFSYYAIAYSVIIAVNLYYLQTYRIELNEAGIRISKWLLLKRLVTWDQLQEIKYKSSSSHGKIITLCYMEQGKLMHIILPKVVLGNLILIKEISERSNLPLPEKYLQFQERFERTYRKKDIIWGCIFFPLALAAIWIYRLSIPYGMTLEVSLGYLGVLALCTLVWLLKICSFCYRMTPRRILQQWCIVFTYASFVILPQSLLLLGDVWDCWGLSLFVTGIVFFAFLQFIRDDMLSVSRYVSLMGVMFLILWLAPTYLIPRASIKEIDIPGARYPWISENILVSFSRNSIYYVDIRNNTQTVYALSNDTSDFIYPFECSPQQDKVIYSIENDKRNINTFYLYDLHTHHSQQIYQQLMDKTEFYYSRNKHLWCPDSRYFILREYSQFSQPSTIRNKFILCDVSVPTTYQFVQINKEVDTFGWSTNTEFIYMTKDNWGSKKSVSTTNLWKCSITLDGRQKPITTNPVKIHSWAGDYHTNYMGNNILYLVSIERTGKSERKYIYNLKTNKMCEFSDSLHIADLHPDKELILYYRDIPGWHVIYEYDLMIGKEREIVRERERVDNVRYSSNGSRIAYNLGRLDECLISVKTDGSDWRKIAGTYIPDVNVIYSANFQWSPYNNQLICEQVAEQFLQEDILTKKYIVDFPD
jgi:hypothetical protein